MSMISREAAYREGAAYGGLIDAVGGVATIVLAVCGLAGLNPPILIAIATIVFAIALLIEGAAMMSEYAQIIVPAGAKAASADAFRGGGLPALFMGGAAGLILGVLALLGVASATLTAAAVIAFGTTLALSSGAVWNLYAMRRAWMKGEGQAPTSGGEMLASELAVGSAGVQAIAGAAAIVLGVLAITTKSADPTLILVALLALGVTIVVTGGSLSSTLLGVPRATLPGAARQS